MIWSARRTTTSSTWSIRARSLLPRIGSRLWWLWFSKSVVRSPNLNTVTLRFARKWRDSWSLPDARLHTRSRFDTTFAELTNKFSLTLSKRILSQVSTSYVNCQSKTFSMRFIKNLTMIKNTSSTHTFLNTKETCSNWRWWLKPTSKTVWVISCRVCLASRTKKKSNSTTRSFSTVSLTGLAHAAWLKWMQSKIDVIVVRKSQISSHLKLKCCQLRK